jgi:hypothetical protein
MTMMMTDNDDGHYGNKDDNVDGKTIGQQQG